MAEQFAIQVKIDPQVADGQRVVDAALLSMEQHGKRMADSVTAAIKEGFQSFAAEAARAAAEEQRAFAKAQDAAQAAAKAVRDAVQAEREFAGAADAVFGILRKQAEAADKEKASLDQLRDSFGKLERSAISATRAEHEYAEAEKLTTAAVKAGIATEAQATAILAEKAKALEQVTVRQEKSSGTFAEQARGWIRGNGAALEVVDGIGKLGLALGTVNQTVALGKMAWSAFGGALDLVDAKMGGVKMTAESLQELLDSGALRNLPGIRDLLGDPREMEGGWLEGKMWERETGGWAANGLDFVDRMFDAAIAQLEQNTQDYEDAARKASDAITAAQNRVFSRNYAFDAARQEASLALARENERKRLAKPGAQPFWDPKWGERDPEFRAPRRRGRTAPEDPHATSAVLDFVRAMESAAEAIAKARAEEDAMASAAEAFGDGIVMTYYDITGAIESFTDASEESSEAHGKAAEKSISDAKKLADALEGPLAGAVDGLIDGLVRWEMSWKEWGSSVAQSIAKVLIQLLALQAIQKAFGVGGGGSTVGQLLWGIFGGSPVAGGGGGGGGGGSSERRVVRHTYGDPFGGGGGTSGAIWRAPVMAPRSPGGGAGGGGGSSKVIVVADMRAAALEAMKSPEGERVTIANVDKHRGKLGGR